MSVHLPSPSSPQPPLWLMIGLTTERRHEGGKRTFSEKAPLFRQIVRGKPGFVCNNQNNPIAEEKVSRMNIDEFEAQIALLLTRMEGQPENRHDIYFMIHEKLNELRASGMPLPDDLLELEATLEKEFSAELAGSKSS
ncbi:MAG: hypothetical protein ACR2OR_00685 [Hyphomicrobiales bacterium]